MGILTIFNLNTVGAFLFTLLVIGLFFHPPAVATWENFLRRRSLTQIRCAALSLLIVAGCLVWPEYFDSRVWLPFWFVAGAIQWTNFFIHEAGHVYFGLLDVETVHVLGGTLFQLLVPLLTALFLAVRGFTALAVLGCFWFGTQFPGIAAYIADAPLMKLKAADGGKHDWNVLLTAFDILSWSESIALIFWYAGVVILGCTATAFLTLLNQLVAARSPEGDTR